ncbi:hypothetical protein [Arthrobacter sp. KBS0703]|nr:hypothetical protein [Arthrobacter sp. KBS0703]
MPRSRAENCAGRQFGTNFDRLITSLDTTGQPRVVTGCYLSLIHI